MRWSRNQIAESDLMARVRANQPYRDPRTHLYDVLFCLRKAWSRKNEHELWAPNGQYKETDEFTLITFLGQGHHMLLSFNAVPAEWSEELGLVYTTDDLDTDYAEVFDEIVPLDPIPVEYKTARISSKKGPEAKEFDKYIDQLAGYCVARHRLRGRLHVFHLVGQYSPPTPQHRCYDFTFEQHELDGWRKELIRRRVLLESAPTLESIPLAEHYAWECDFCPLKGSRCEGGGGQRLGYFPYMSQEGAIP